MSSHKNKLEAYVAEKMKEIYKYARPTIASGATPAEKGDIKNPWFGIECVPGSSRILTPNGHKSMEEIYIDDEIIAGDGTIAKVTNKFDRKYDGEIYNIDITGLYYPLEITGEHPIYFREHYNKKPRWITVKELDNILPKIQSTKCKNGYVFMPALKRDKRLYKNKILTRNPDVRWDKNLMRIFGWYISEGFCDKKYPYISFTLGKHETEYADDLFNLIKNTGHGDVKIQNGTTTLVVFWKCKKFYNIIMNLFGTGALSKNIPLWFNNLTDDLLLEFIKYAIRGDGHREPTCVHYSSYSENILYGIKNILITLGYHFDISGTSGHEKTETQIRILGSNKDLNIICDKKPTKTVKINKKERKRRMLHTAGGCWCRIRKITKEKFIGTVFNIETTSKNYICESILVHNCKQKKTAKAFSIPYDEWIKNCEESDNQYKDPVFIVENEDGERIAAMRLEEWFQLIYELMELRVLQEKQ